MRRDGIGVDIYHVVTCRVAPDLIGAQMMGVRRSTAFGLDPRRDRLAVVPADVCVRGAWKKGKPGSERDDAADSPLSWPSYSAQTIHPGFRPRTFERAQHAKSWKPPHEDHGGFVCCKPAQSCVREGRTKRDSATR